MILTAEAAGEVELDGGDGFGEFPGRGLGMATGLSAGKQGGPMAKERGVAAQGGGSGPFLAS